MNAKGNNIKAIMFVRVSSNAQDYTLYFSFNLHYLMKITWRNRPAPLYCFEIV